MATLQELRAAVLAVLGVQGIAPVLQLNSNTRERAFEVYVFSLILRAVRQAGGTVELRGVNSGLNPNPLVFRGGPGNMGSTAQDFCFARCSLGNREFEVHVDVTYVGGSGATHEVDVSIYDRMAAEAVRQNPGMQPVARKLRAAVECKFYDGGLGTVLGRVFVGLVADLGTLLLECFVTNGQHQGLALYFHSRKQQPYFCVSPIIAGNPDRFVHNVEQSLRKWASVM